MEWSVKWWLLVLFIHHACSNQKESSLIRNKRLSVQPYYGNLQKPGRSSWTTWSSCTKTCDSGYQFRTCRQYGMSGSSYLRAFGCNGSRYRLGCNGSSYRYGCNGPRYKVCNKNIFCGCPNGYKEKSEKKRKRRLSIRCRTKKHFFVRSLGISFGSNGFYGRKKRSIGFNYGSLGGSRPSYGSSGYCPPAPPPSPTYDNKDIANVCCFIIYSKSKGILVLTDHVLQNNDFKKKCWNPGHRCAYSKYDDLSKKIDNTTETCISNIGNDYTCCSQLNGEICKDPTLTYIGPSLIYKYKANIRLVSTNSEQYDRCSKDCQNIANCKENPESKDWCQKVEVEEAIVEDDLVLKPVPDVCEPIVEEEPVIQSAEYYPKALVPDSKRRKRATWRSCPPFNHWKFNCYQAVHYMIYYLQKSYYSLINRKGERKTRHFKHDCCAEFQAKCRDKKVFKKHEDLAICPAD